MMRRCLFLVMLAACFCGMAWADEADEADDTAQRQRIARQREEVQARFASDEKTCYRQFAVTECLNEARAGRRTALGDLRRQEITLNDAVRRRRSADHARALEERSDAQQGAVRRRADAEQKQPARQERAAGKATERVRREGSAVPAKIGAGGTKVEAGAEQLNERRYEEKLREAAQRKARVDRRAEEAKNKPAQPLPVPP